jgi:hypothetical protein
VDPDYPVTAPLRAIFDGASGFGMTHAEIWRAFDDSLDAVGADATVDEYLHELTGELAQRILQKQRSAPSEEQRVGSRGRV